MKSLILLLAVFFLVGAPFQSNAALNFTALNVAEIPTSVDLNSGINSVVPGAGVLVGSSGAGALSYTSGNNAVQGPASANFDVTLNNFTGASVNSWLIRFVTIDLGISVPQAFKTSSLSTSIGTSQGAAFSPVNDFSGTSFVILHSIPNNGSDTFRLAFSSLPGGQLDTFGVTMSGLSITALIPEPSSALLLTGVLGLFGSTFRRRRNLDGV